MSSTSTERVKRPDAPLFAARRREKKSGQGEPQDLSQETSPPSATIQTKIIDSRKKTGNSSRGDSSRREPRADQPSSINQQKHESKALPPKPQAPPPRAHKPMPDADVPRSTPGVLHVSTAAESHPSPTAPSRRGRGRGRGRGRSDRVPANDASGGGSLTRVSTSRASESETTLTRDWEAAERELPSLEKKLARALQRAQEDGNISTVMDIHEELRDR